MYQFSHPCLETAFRLDCDEVVITGQSTAKRKGREELIFECRLVNRQKWCENCGCEGKSRSSRSRWLIHCPNATRPVRLLARLRGFKCTGCKRYWSEKVSETLAPCGSKLTHGAINWALASVILDGMSISAAARNLGAAWTTVNTAVLDAGYAHLISDPSRFDGVKTIGIDEHCWKHTGWQKDRFVTVIIDLTPRENGGTARLLDMIPGRSKQVLKSWLKKQDVKFRLNVKTVAMDGFTGYKSAVHEVISHATTVMDPFHVVQLAGDKLTACRQRLQQEILGRRGRRGDPLFVARRLLLKTNKLIEDKARDKVDAILQDEKYRPLVEIWKVYQAIIEAYRHDSPGKGRMRMSAVIDALDSTNTKSIPELRTLARTLKRRRDDILAYFTHPYSSNGPTEGINGRIEHLRGIALGFRNPENYIKRSLLHTGGFKTKIHSLL